MSQKRKLDLSREADCAMALQWMDESDEGDNFAETDSDCSELEDNVETQDAESDILEVCYFDMCLLYKIIQHCFRLALKKIAKVILGILHMYQKIKRFGTKMHLDLHEPPLKI